MKKLDIFIKISYSFLLLYFVSSFIIVLLNYSGASCGILLLQVRRAQQKNAPDHNSRFVCLHLGEHFSSSTASGKPDAVAAGDLIVSAL